MISFQNVSRFYNDWPALENIELTVESGEFLVLSGPSGAGKTTLFRLIWMGDLPTSGVVEVSGYRSDRIRKGDLSSLRRKLGIVFQDFRLLSERTVFDNVALPLQVAGSSPRAVRKRVFSLLAEMELIHRRSSYPHELSGGEQQRVAIARAMVAHPVILLADEPTGNLDPDVSKHVIELLLDINRTGTAVILATHDPRQIPAGTAKYLYLDRGNLANPVSWDGYNKL
ncbi:MAG: ATP-binding cassette domain-containing protein [Candidatus Aegiribacteria sp.]|nr:ATP-binding cassette domain-containing protein [Candidatus Aegiribacteria sp.]